MSSENTAYGVVSYDIVWGSPLDGQGRAVRHVGDPANASYIVKGPPGVLVNLVNQHSSDATSRSVVPNLVIPASGEIRWDNVQTPIPSGSYIPGEYRCTAEFYDSQNGYIAPAVLGGKLLIVAAAAPQKSSGLVGGTLPIYKPVVQPVDYTGNESGDIYKGGEFTFGGGWGIGTNPPVVVTPSTDSHPGQYWDGTQWVPIDGGSGGSNVLPPGTSVGGTNPPASSGGGSAPPTSPIGTGSGGGTGAVSPPASGNQGGSSAPTPASSFDSRFLMVAAAVVFFVVYRGGVR